MRFKQQYTRDIDSIWEDAAQGGLAQFEHAASFYGVENNGLSSEITDRRVRRDVLSDAHFAEIQDGRPTTIKSFSTTTFQMSSADMQKLLLLNGAPDDGRLKDGLWGPFSAGTSSGVGRALGFSNVSTKGVNFGTLPNGKRGYRSVRVAPKAFVNTLINRASARGGDVTAADCQKFPPNALRSTVRVLGSRQVNATGAFDSVLDGAFRTQAEKLGLTVSVFRPANDGNIVVCPGSTAESMFKRAAELLNCVEVSALKVNRALIALGHRSGGTVKPGKPTKPLNAALKYASERISTASMAKLRTEAAARCPSFVNARFTPSGAGFSTASALVCPPECWTVISKAANDAIKKAEQATARRINRTFTKAIPVKNVQTLLMQCNRGAKKTLRNDKEFKQGRWGEDTGKEFNRVLGKLGFKNVSIILSDKRRKVRIKPQSAWDALKKCAADEEAKRKRIIARRKAEAERKKREDLNVPDGQPMEPEPTPTEADATAEVIQDEPEDPFDTGPIVPDEPSDDIVEPQQAGIGGAPALLAGLAAIALILFASQQRE